jgi:hypothetical protein
MFTDDSAFDQFFAWLQTFDSRVLINEAEVESNFVMPFFYFLGYTEGYRRSHYPVKTYESGKPGRKPEIDLIYFSTSQQEQQNANTSLLLIEVKEPKESHLDEALIQAHRYAELLAPLFLIATNARRILIVKRHVLYDEELICDVTFAQLREFATASQLYRILHFDVVKRFKEHLVDDLPHPLYVSIMHELDRHLDLHDQLAKGDFKRSQRQEGRRLTAVEPKVAVVCDLPLAFGDGKCHITFSNLLLRGLTCHLTHRQILENLLTGFGTPASWGTRRFLREREKGSFEAQLGQTIVLLSEQEANDLCICIDVIGSKYKEIIVDTEEALQTWEYSPVSLSGYQMHGFHILTVQRWLWDLMLRFAGEFDFLEGTSSWHIFERGLNHFRVLLKRDGKGYDENVLLYPSYGHSNLPSDTVDVLYCIEEDRYLTATEDADQLSWKQVVGPQGIWTAAYTERWLIHQFIPQVLARYRLRRFLVRHLKHKKDVSYMRTHVLEDWEISCTQIHHPSQLAPAMHRIQGWFHSYEECQIAASLLRPFYSALTNVVRHIDPSHLAPQYFPYVGGYIFGATRKASGEHLQEREEDPIILEAKDDPSQTEEEDPAQMMNAMIEALDEHVHRIHQENHEYSRVVDHLSCAFIALVEHGKIHCGQEHLNAAKDAILPLLDLSRFEMRYVLRPPWE